MTTNARTQDVLAHQEHRQRGMVRQRCTLEAGKRYRRQGQAGKRRSTCPAAGVAGELACAGVRHDAVLANFFAGGTRHGGGPVEDRDAILRLLPEHRMAQAHGWVAGELNVRPTRDTAVRHTRRAKMGIRGDGAVLKLRLRGPTQ